MSTSTNPLASGVPALQPPEPTQTMLSPDGTPGEVPVERVQDAVKGGFKLGISMTAPDGTPGTIPVDQAHDAIKTGFKPIVRMSTAPIEGETAWGGIKRGAGSVYNTVAGIAPSTNTEAATTIPGKALGMAEDVAGGINNLTGITTVTDSLKNAGHMIDAYEKVRASGGSIVDGLHAANERGKQADQITPFVTQRLADFQKNPTAATSQALVEAAALAASIWAGGKVLGKSMPEVTRLVPGAAEAEALRPPTNPFRSTAAPVEPEAATVPAEAEAAAATSKIEPVVSARAAKAGLAPGKAGLTPEAASAQTTQSALDAQKTTQANVDQALQDIATNHAKANGLPAPAAGTATRDVLTNNGDALVEAGKANYKILDKFTDGKFTNAQDELKNAQLELRAKAGMTDVDTSSLEANVTRAQWNVDQLFDNAVKNGMPKETADAARTQFRTGQATLDAANDVRMANKVRTPAGVRTTDLNALENRWTARYDSGRLQQAFGEQGARDALAQVRAARESGEFIQSMPPTESKALQDLIRQNTTTGKFAKPTDWGKVQEAFSKLPDRAARFSDIPKVEKFINNQVFYQKLISRAVKGAGVFAGGALAGEGWNITH